MLSKPTDNWTNDVYLDPMLLFSESVPLETVYIQGLSLDDVLKSKIRHFRQLEQQTRYFEKLFEREKQAVIHEAIHLGIGEFIASQRHSKITHKVDDRPYSLVREHCTAFVHSRNDSC